MIFFHDASSTARLESPPNFSHGLMFQLATFLYRRLPSGYVKIAIENDHRNSGFTHWKGWFSMVMLVYQRVYRIRFPLFPHDITVIRWMRAKCCIRPPGRWDSASKSCGTSGYSKIWQCHGIWDMDIGYIYRERERIHIYIGCIYIYI